MSDLINFNLIFYREAIHVMYLYIELFDLKNKSFLDSLRIILKTFWLPGEAQKIDRIMEKIAGYYFKENPNQKIFASADAAYILAYSIIMLTTDLHNEQVKTKMTLEQYMLMNSKINDGDDLPKEFIEEIYNSIKNEKINLESKFEENHKINDIKMSTISENTIKKLQKYINESNQTTVILDYETDILVKPIFQLIWKQCLVTFSVVINSISDVDLLYVTFSGMRIAIRVSAMLCDNFALDAFLKALVNFTNLSTGSIVTEMQDKNIDAIRALLTIANEDGNYLNDNWVDILNVISNLELVQNMIQTTQSYIMLNQQNTKNISLFSLKSLNLNNNSFNLLTNSFKNDKKLHISKSVKEIISQNILISVDKTFANTKYLDDASIVVFVKSVCQVSLNELKEKPNGRMFMLIKIVEVAHYNMDRIRISWRKIWFVLREYFNNVACMENENISSFCIASLRQLALKFIEKEELENFHFQKEFLKPFEEIFSKSNSRSTKELILKCIDQIIKMQFNNIKSGWSSLLSVIGQAAQESDVEMVKKGYAILVYILKEICNLKNVNMRDTTICTLVVFASPNLFQNKSTHTQISSNNLKENLNLNEQITTIDDQEMSQNEKITIAMLNASLNNPQNTPITSEFKCSSSRSSIVAASFSRNHSIDNPSDLLKSHLLISTNNDSVFDIYNLDLNKIDQREKIAYEVFGMLKNYVENVLLKLSNFNEPKEYAKNQWITSWIVLFNRLAFLAQNGSENIANMALRNLNSILNDYGHLFTPELWTDVINIYLNIFSICKHSNKTLSYRQVF